MSTTPSPERPAATEPNASGAGSAPSPRTPTGPASDSTGSGSTEGQTQPGQAPTGRGPVGQAPPPRRGHGSGNWRSLVISMGIITALVFVWLALLPRPGQQPHTAVDVSASARQVAQETHWPISVPRLGPDWVPTSVRLQPSATGQRTWHIGYNLNSDDGVYVGVEQTPRTENQAADQAWIESQVKSGKPLGEVQLAGRRWERYRVDSDNPRDSLVRRGDDAMLIVVTGLGGEGRLQEVASALQPFAAPSPTSPSAASPSAASPSSAGSSPSAGS